MSDRQQYAMHDDEVDLAELIRSLWQQKLLIAGVALGVTLLAVAYALLATPYYKVQSVVRPVDQGALDALNGTEIYELTPSDALARVATALSSYENRLKYFRENQVLFAPLAEPGRSLEQVFEEFNAEAFSMLQPDPKKTGGLKEYVGLSLVYPRGIDGVAVVNGMVMAAIQAEQQAVAEDLKALIANRLASLEQKIEAARANYSASKEAQIATLLEEDALQRAKLQDELEALRGELKLRRKSRINELDEAIRIAESLGISKPTTPSAMADSQARGQVVRTEVNSREIPLYFMGTEALQAEQKALSERVSDDFVEPRIAEIKKELELLKHNRQVELLEQRQDEDLYLKDLALWREEAARLEGIKFDASNLQLVRVDQMALEPLARVKPKRLLILALGVAIGIMLGVFIALLRNLLRNGPASLQGIR